MWLNRQRNLSINARIVKLEGNIEYRFDIIKMFKGAVFLDGGNIWLLRQDPDTTRTEGGSFNVKTFLNQLAVGTGLGLRFDFSFFVLRLDTAFPLRKPWLVTRARILGSSTISTLAVKRGEKKILSLTLRSDIHFNQWV